MTYLPFHHKYRPQTFQDLVGQEAIATTLTNALSAQRIAPAYLFTGPRGTGKTSSARIFAKSLNCMASEVPTAQPCGQCPVCRSIALGNALDVVEIDAASNTGVDNIREIIDRAQYAPVQCRYKVYTIDECHMLSTAAFNSLLKTLEEPPPHVVFILATTDPQRVLPTIISRCQKFDYRRIPLAAMVQHLTYIAQQERMQITAGAVQLVAQIAQGGLRDAESLLDQLSLLQEEVTVDRVWDLVGSVPEKDLLAICQALQGGQLSAVLDRCRQLLERGKEPLMILQNLAGFYRDLSIAKTVRQRSDLTNLTPEIWPAVCELAATLPLQQILAGQQHLKDSEQQLKTSTQPRLWLEVTLLGLLPSAHLSNSTAPTTAPVSIVPPPSVPAAAAPQIAVPAIPVMASSPPPLPVAAPEPEMPTVDLATTWQQVIGKLLPSGKGLFGSHCQLLAVAGSTATIGVKSATLIKLAEGQKQHVQKALSSILDRPITVILQLGLGEPVAALATQPAKTPIAAPPLNPVPPVVVSPIKDPAEEEMLDSPGEPDDDSGPDYADEELFGKLVVPQLTTPEPVEVPVTPGQNPQQSIVPPITVAEQPNTFDWSEPALPAPNGQGNAASFFAPDSVPEIDLEPTPVLFTDLDLDEAAARLAQQFGGEIVEEYVTIWNL